MSYILEALKKSDQQRQLGATPTLQATQVTVPAPKRPLFIYYGLLAAVLLGAGIMIGWLRPWQPELPPPVTEPLAAKSPISISQQAASASLTAPPEMLGAMKPNNPALVNSGTPSAAARPFLISPCQRSPPALPALHRSKKRYPSTNCLSKFSRRFRL